MNLHFVSSQQCQSVSVSGLLNVGASGLQANQKSNQCDHSHYSWVMLQRGALKLTVDQKWSKFDNFSPFCPLEAQKLKNNHPDFVV